MQAIFAPATGVGAPPLSVEMALEDDPGDIGAGDAVGGKPGIGAGIDAPEIIGRPLRGGDRAEDADDVPAKGADCPDQVETDNGAGNGET